mgnify:CR=1 FL=1
MTSIQESSDTFANELKLNAKESIQPYVKGIQEPSLTLAVEL